MKPINITIAKTNYCVMYITRFKVLKNIKQLLDIYPRSNLNMVIYFKLYLDSWNNTRFYNKNLTTASSNKESLWTLAFAVTSDRVTTVRVASVKSPGYRDVFDFLLDRTSARFAVTFIIDDELTCCWFLRDSAYKNIEMTFFHWK